MSHQPLKGQKALVTGASSGIGAGVAVALAGAGADVVVNYASSAAGAQKVVDEIKATGRDAMAVKADVAVGEDVGRAGELRYLAARHLAGLLAAGRDPGQLRQGALGHLA